jgi:hypothetical protein
MRSQHLVLLSLIAVERGDLAVALDWALKAVQAAREEYATSRHALKYLLNSLAAKASVLDSLGHHDEALAVDAEREALAPAEPMHRAVLMRRAIRHIAQGEEAEAERLLRLRISDMGTEWAAVYSSRVIEKALRPHTVLAELLERRGTKEALAEAKTLRDAISQHRARHEARIAAALEETRAAAAEEVRQWREMRAKAMEQQMGGKKKGKGKKKGRKGKSKGKGKASSAAAAIEGEPPHEPIGGEVDGAAAVEGAVPAEAEQQSQVGESQLPGEEKEKEEEEEEEEEREECAICLQDLELEDDDVEGEALVVLTCGHRFHEICGDMWCAKCRDKGWGVTCPRCRAPYVLV